MAYATIKIEGSKLVNTSFHNTDAFEIVNKIPSNYFIWNIGENMGTKEYIPICEMLHPENKEDFSINRNTLKAVKVTPEEWDALNKAASFGVGSLQDAEKALRSKRHGYISDNKRKFAALTIDIFRKIS